MKKLKALLECASSLYCSVTKLVIAWDIFILVDHKLLIKKHRNAYQACSACGLSRSVCDIRATRE
jgi:hypothetical protein